MERTVVRGPQERVSLWGQARREERCPAAGEGTAAAGTKSLGGRSRVPGRRETWTGERPGRVPKRATHGPMKARVTFETAEAREEARRGPERVTHGPKQARVTSETAVGVVMKRECPHEADQTWPNLLSDTRKS